MNYLVTSESAAPGHPDKIADQISDAVLDTYLTADSLARTAVETLVAVDKVIIAGEVQGPEHVAASLDNIVRTLIDKIGYEQSNIFNSHTVKIQTLLHKQSQEIARGINIGTNNYIGAGDQGLMFGYATDETSCFMPASIYYAHKVLQNILHLVRVGKLPKLGPDGKSQVTLSYEANRPINVMHVVLSIQHPPDIQHTELHELLYPYIQQVFAEQWHLQEENILINPAGKFTLGGPMSDCGVTGRKIIVDTYGGGIPHGGGAFSGKDPTKVDRSAAYMARYLAKNIVAAKLARRCLVQLAYAIGGVKPLFLHINTYENNKVNTKELAQFILKHIDLSPDGIREYLQLNKPIYLKTTTYGHFGRNYTTEGHFSWEKIDFAQLLRSKFAS